MRSAGSELEREAAELALCQCARCLSLEAPLAALPGVLPALTLRLNNSGFGAALHGPLLAALLTVVRQSPTPEEEALGLLPHLLDWLRAAAAAPLVRPNTVSAGMLVLSAFVKDKSDARAEFLHARVAAAGAFPVLAAILGQPRFAAGTEELAVMMVRLCLALARRLVAGSRLRAEWLACTPGLLAQFVRVLSHPDAGAGAEAAWLIVAYLDAVKPAAPAAAPPEALRLLDAGALPALVASLRRPMAASASPDILAICAASAAAEALGAICRSSLAMLRCVVEEEGALPALVALLEPRPPAMAVVVAAECLDFIASAIVDVIADKSSARVGVSPLALNDALDAAGALPRLLRLLESRPSHFRNSGDGALAQDAAALLGLHNRAVYACIKMLIRLILMQSSPRRAAHVLRTAGTTVRRLARRGPTPEIQEQAVQLLNFLERGGA